LVVVERILYWREINYLNTKVSLERRIAVLENSIFAILSLFLIGGALMVLWSREIVLSAFGFLIAMLAMAGLFALLENSFLFLAQVMITVGAVVVLSLIVVTTINLKRDNLPKESNRVGWIVFSSLVVSPIAILIYKSLTMIDKNFQETKDGYGSLKVMGEELFSSWVLPFEIVSVLLLAAMFAAIVIARKESKI
jgi:NADH-quinone oxidoreductase subunit J